MDLNQFQRWADEKPYSSCRGRCLTIEVKGGVPAKITAGEWIEGQYMCQVNILSVGEIDLVGKKEAEERATLERLAAKYGER